MEHLQDVHKWDITPMDHRELKVVTMISNPIRFKSRYNLYRKFAKHMADSGVDLVTMEVQLGERPFEITEAGNPCHIQLRTRSEVWHKENALNLCAAHLYKLWPDWKYFAWIDADISFVSSYWAAEAISMLQRFRVIQLWSTAIDVTNSMDYDRHVRSFCWCLRESQRHPEKVGVLDKEGKWIFNRGIEDYRNYAAQQKPFWHSGYAWAMRRDAYEKMGGPWDGGLFEYGILGSGDHHMILAWNGEVERSAPERISKRYYDLLMEYQARADKYIQRDLGYIDGTIIHYWHGNKGDRGYRTRWEILRDAGYDPTYDITRDPSGLFALTDRNIKFRDELRCYFEARNEDFPK